MTFGYNPLCFTATISAVKKARLGRDAANTPAGVTTLHTTHAPLLPLHISVALPYLCRTSYRDASLCFGDVPFLQALMSCHLHGVNRNTDFLLTELPAAQVWESDMAGGLDE